MPAVCDQLGSEGLKLSKAAINQTANRTIRISNASRRRRPLLNFVNVTSLSSVYSRLKKGSRVTGFSCPMLKRTTVPGYPSTVAVWINRSVIKIRRFCTCSVLARLNNQTITLLDFFHNNVCPCVIDAVQTQQGFPATYGKLTYPARVFSTGSRNHQILNDTPEFLQVFVQRY